MWLMCARSTYQHSTFNDWHFQRRRENKYSIWHSFWTELMLGIEYIGKRCMWQWWHVEIRAWIDVCNQWTDTYSFLNWQLSAFYGICVSFPKSFHPGFVFLCAHMSIAIARLIHFSLVFSFFLFLSSLTFLLRELNASANIELLHVRDGILL